MSIVIPAAVLAAIVLRPGSHGASSSSQVIAPGAPTRATIGSKAPDFTLPDLNGTPVRLSHFRGRPVVLTFFASWCNPCEHDMPVLEKEQQSHGNNVAIVGVNYRDAVGDTRDFVRRLQVTFPTLVEDAVDNPVAARYDVHAMPDTLFIDKNGVVRERLYGEISTHDLQAAVARLVRA